MKKLLILILTVCYFIGCSQILIVETNKDDAKIYLDDKYVGSGKKVKVKLYGKFLGKNTKNRIVAKSNGYSDAQITIQPNYWELHDAHVHIVVWTFGWVMFAPLWYWNSKAYKYAPDEKTGDPLKVRLEFLDE